MKGLSKLKWGQARRLHYTKKQWLRAKKISATMKKKFQLYTRPRIKGKFTKGTFKPKQKNTAYMVVGGFDITDLKGYEGRNMFLEVSIEIIKPKNYNIDNAIMEISNFIQQWFVDYFGFNPANITGHKNKSVVSKFNIGLDSEISTDQNEQINILQLDFNKPLFRDKLKRDLESFLKTL